MNAPKPVIVDQADLDWEGWRDADLAAESRIRWKLLITGERTESVGLVTGIAEIPPGAQLLPHHHEPEETYYIVSGRGQMEIDGRTTAVGRAAQSTFHPRPGTLSGAPARSRWCSCSVSPGTASIRSSITSIGSGGGIARRRPVLIDSPPR